MPTQDLTPQRIARLLALAKTLPLREQSIDKPLRHEDGSRSTLAETMTDESEPVLEVLVDDERRALIAEVVANAIGTLPPRQRAIVSLRHGLDGAPPMTAEDTGKAVALTAGRVAQLEAEISEAVGRAITAGLERLVAPPPPPPAERWRRPDGRVLIIEPKRAGV